MVLTTKEAAVILGVDERTVRRYVDKGLLKPICYNSPPKFNKESIEVLKERIDAYQKFHPLMPFTYVHYLTNVPMNSIEDYLLNFGNFNLRSMLDNKLCLHLLWSGLKIHEFYRKCYMEEYQPSDSIKEDMLYVGETAQRLRVKDIHVIHKLVKDNTLKYYDCSFRKKKKIFISLESLLEYLGDDSQEIFYRSDEIVKMFNHEQLSREELKKEINRIDKLAKKMKLGRKIIPECDNSCYLFTRDEIELLRDRYYMTK